MTAFLFKPVHSQHLGEKTVFNPQEGIFSELLRSFSYAQTLRSSSVLHVKSDQALKMAAASYHPQHVLSRRARHSSVCPKCVPHAYSIALIHEAVHNPGGVSDLLYPHYLINRFNATDFCE